MIKIPISDCSYETRRSLGLVGYNQTLVDKFTSWARESLQGTVSIGLINGQARYLIFDCEEDRVSFVLGWCNQNV